LLFIPKRQATERSSRAIEELADEHSVKLIEEFAKPWLNLNHIQLN
jgi:hypothetical protein